LLKQEILVSTIISTMQVLAAILISTSVFLGFCMAGEPCFEDEPCPFTVAPHSVKDEAEDSGRSHNHHSTSKSEHRRFSRQLYPSDDVCNRGDLRKVIDENIVEGNAGVSRSKIYKAFFETGAARDQINLICSTSPLSYNVVSSTYCESTFKGVTCLIFHS
uniref:Ground-like domain-containing protein n=1 Tax=Anisakis simplex TaxID=6269 RepID=A0A0M3KF56_ANISI